MNTDLATILFETQESKVGAGFLIALFGLYFTAVAMTKGVKLTQKLVIVAIVAVVVIPYAVISLTHINCLITGNKGGDAWWCTGYSWFYLAMLALTVISIGVALVSGMLTDDTIAKASAQANQEASNAIAEGYFNGTVPVPAGVVVTTPVAVDTIPADAHEEDIEDDKKPAAFSRDIQYAPHVYRTPEATAFPKPVPSRRISATSFSASM